MTTIHQKHQILESLDALNAVQTEKVLEFIKGITNASHEETYQRFKREGMKEIRQALSKRRKLHPSF